MTRNIYCDGSDQLCGEQHICTRLEGHDGDHYDAVIQRRWHNEANDYGQGNESCRASR